MARKCKKDDHPESHERWLVSYADFITLLFAFFVVMYAISNQDAKKAKDFENSIRQQFNRFGGGEGKSGGLNRVAKQSSPVEAPIRQHMESDSMRKTQFKIETYLEENMSADEMERVVKDITSDTLGVRISVAADQIFSSGSYHFRKDAVTALNKIGKLLKDSGKKVIVEGHTNLAGKNKELLPTPWELSSMQSTKVARFLIKVHKLNPSWVSAVAYGNERPTIPTATTTSELARNRRIDFLVVTESSPL